MTLTREEAHESKEMESLRVHADALLSLSSPAASSTATTAAGSKPVTTATTAAGRRALAAEGVFECKTCSKRFTSFQALGGHRTSHTRLQARMLLHDAADAAERDRARVHECAVCGLEFSMGQALGGHMRRHRGEAAPSTTSSAAVHGEASSGATQQQELMPDLNYPPMDDCGGDGQGTSADRSSERQLLDLLG
ncbi:zinc finger protein ZAT11-like [Hordeum vulgare]|uniref:Predicted protein n=2 Tax=Hordeum vulgare subsp. vulgare TaxID=112509 RepID=F2E7E2_HORVV|nr:zinc finger protein ZAT11-like [Hordeum vulgare]BAK03264.1 predicted protein [Hordeum vulgare subsp. vulgare]